MRVIMPLEVDNATLIASDVPDTDFTVWTAGTYTLGDERQYDLQAYRVIVASTTDRPDVGVLAEPPTWLKLGYINRWRMFRDGSDSKTVQQDLIEVDLQFTSLVNSVALFGLEGRDVTVTMNDYVEGQVYQRTQDIVDIGVVDWYDYFFADYAFRENLLFDDLPAYIGADIKIEISAETGSDAACGRVIFGALRSVGITEYGTTVSSVNYGRKVRDGFGNLILEPRRIVRLVDFNIKVPTGLVSTAASTLDDLANVPTAFIGDDTIDATIIFGVYNDFRINFSNPALSDATVEVEGF
jgi:hypothetical protein